MRQIGTFNSDSEMENFYRPRSPQIVYESKPTPKIRITEHGLRLCLLDCQKVFTSWQSPLGICLTITVTLTSVNDFKDFIVDPSVWEAGFKILLVGIGLWGIKEVWSLVCVCWKERRLVNPYKVDYIIEKIKKDSDLYRENESVRHSASHSDTDQSTPPPPDPPTA